MKKLYIIAAIALLALFVNDTRAQRTEVTFYTTNGNFKVLLYDSLTTVTVDSFLARVSRKFYDGLIFHRVIANFMIQGGDPTGTGSGGTGTKIPDEFHPSLKNIPGALSMANTGQPNTGDCQFYVNVVTNAHLDNKHTVFGMVTNNYSVVDAISKVPTGANNKPVTDVKMDSIRVTKFPAGVKNIETNQPVAVYPNPNNGIFSIDVPGGKTELVVTNINGQVVYATATEQAVKFSIDMSSQPKGIYMLTMMNGAATLHRKVVVQ
jgi:cyclophilin family peptidyl-prolyl cis-trans isomerase